MKFDPEILARKNILDMVPYSSARDEFSGTASVFLDANESPYNSPYNRYPDPLQKKLKEAVGNLFLVTEEKIFLGNGSDEAIDLLFRVFCEPGKDNVISIVPSYGMYRVCAAMNDIEVRKVLLNPDYSISASSILECADTRSKIIFLCSPNNPTGNLLEISEIKTLLMQFRGIVVVDEAYIDFAGTEGTLPFLKDYQNLVVLRTFSKAWGLAGIRLGMAFADERVVRLMTKIKYPYNLNILTQELGLKMISDKEKKDRWVNQIVLEREKMKNELGKFEIVDNIYPSDANFLLVKVKNAFKLYNYLKDRGIIVRDRSGVRLCEGSLRITIGTHEENSTLLKELKIFVNSRS